LALGRFAAAGDGIGDSTLNLLSSLKVFVLQAFQPLVTVGDSSLAKAFFSVVFFCFFNAEKL
jgi:hypothetical protein